DSIHNIALCSHTAILCGNIKCSRRLKFLSEERMACGIGACLACVCKSREKDAHSNVNNKRICKDGPVFLSTEVEI
ncbi:MAG: dihydroorotate dehydrogenase electron transfer subunit, partial [Ruminococcus sp.]|nr:dihydroorotate dehydrogenase electron transfer subunit [Ruminococcus sp.]